MNSKKTQNIICQKKILEPLKDVDFCKVSKASAELMIERFCNGKEIEFPFSD